MNAYNTRAAIAVALSFPAPAAPNDTNSEKVETVSMTGIRAPH